MQVGLQCAHLHPPSDTAVGCRVEGFRRLDKRVARCLEGELFLVFHLMMTGHFHRKKTATRPTRERDLLALRFDDITVMVSEAGCNKRASLRLVEDESNLADRQLSCLLRDDWPRTSEELEARMPSGSET